MDDQALPEADGPRRRWPRDLWLDAIWDDPTVKTTERVVAYAYARYAASGVRSWCNWKEMTLRTGLKSRDAIWRASSGLVAAGWLKQVEPARGHKAPVYELTHPDSASSPSSGPLNASSSPGNGPLGSQASGKRTRGVRQTDGRGPGNGPNLSDVFSDEDKDLSQVDGGAVESGRERDRLNESRAQSVPEQLLNAIGAAPDEAAAVVGWLTTTDRLPPHQRPKSNQWWRTCHENGDLLDYLVEWRELQAKRQPRPPVQREPDPEPEPCPRHGTPGDQSCHGCVYQAVEADYDKHCGQMPTFYPKVRRPIWAQIAANREADAADPTGTPSPKAFAALANLIGGGT